MNRYFIAGCVGAGLIWLVWFLSQKGGRHESHLSAAELFPALVGASSPGALPDQLVDNERQTSAALTNKEEVSRWYGRVLHADGTPAPSGTLEWAPSLSLGNHGQVDGAPVVDGIFEVEDRTIVPYLAANTDVVDPRIFRFRTSEDVLVPVLDARVLAVGTEKQVSITIPDQAMLYLRVVDLARNDILAASIEIGMTGYVALASVLEASDAGNYKAQVPLRGETVAVRVSAPGYASRTIAVRMDSPEVVLEVPLARILGFGVLYEPHDPEVSILVRAIGGNEELLTYPVYSDWAPILDGVQETLELKGQAVKWYVWQEREWLTEKLEMDVFLRRDFEDAHSLGPVQIRQITAPDFAVLRADAFQWHVGSYVDVTFLPAEALAPNPPGQMPLEFVGEEAATGRRVKRVLLGEHLRDTCYRYPLAPGNYTMQSCRAEFVRRYGGAATLAWPIAVTIGSNDSSAHVMAELDRSSKYIGYEVVDAYGFPLEMNVLLLNDGELPIRPATATRRKYRFVSESQRYCIAGVDIQSGVATKLVGGLSWTPTLSQDGVWRIPIDGIGHSSDRLFE